MNRRTFLASSALAVPSASVAALAVAPAVAPDPALAAAQEWLRLRKAEEAAEHLDDEEAYRLHDQEFAAKERACRMAATTPAGIAAQALIALDLYSERSGAVGDPNGYSGGHWRNDIDLDLLRSIHAAARRLAEQEEEGRA